MRIAVIAFVAGVCLLQMQPVLPPQWLMFSCVAAAIGIFLCSRTVPRMAIRLPLLIAAGLAFGFAWAGWMGQAALTKKLPADWEGRDVTLVGVADSLPYRFEQGVRFGFTVEKAWDDERRAAPVPSRVALSWYAPRYAEDEAADVPDVRPGERWQLRVRLQRPHGNANPYGFDYEAWLLEQGIRATGYVRGRNAGEAGNRRLDAFVFGVKNMIERGRAVLRDRIESELPGRKYASVIVALVVGDQRAISQAEWKMFSRTGVSHLMSISGLHITMVAGMFAALVFGLWRRSFFTSLQLPTLLPAQKAAALAGGLAALVYVALAGFGVPAQRTLYMLSVVAVALWCNRIASVSHILAIALGLVTLIDPWAVLWPGFWLSFGAVALILYATVGRLERAGEGAMRKWMHVLRSAAYTQYVVTLGLVPLTMLLFSQVSVASPVANAVAIPVVSFIVTPLALIGSVMPAPLCGWLLTVSHAVIELLAGFLSWMSASSHAAWQAPAPPVWMFAAATAGIAWMLAPRGWPARWLGLFCLLPLVFNVPSHPQAGRLQVTAFDVGQGMALLVETERHRLLYDTGPSYSPESDGGNRIILPYLRARGIGALDGMMVSHQDNDHSGGALSVIDEIDVGWVSSSLPDTSALATRAREHRRCMAGQQWDWDGVHFEVLHPDDSVYANEKLKPNARSCALKISSRGHAILLAGDIEAKQEAQLVDGNAGKLRADVLLAPHHGSGTSSAAAFLAAVQPSMALFQVGYRNRYHHPKREVFERYGELGIRRLRTDESGAITLQFGSTIDVSVYREEHARYWYEK